MAGEEAPCFLELADRWLRAGGDAVCPLLLSSAGGSFRSGLQHRLLQEAAAPGLRLFLRQQLLAVTDLGFRLEAAAFGGSGEAALEAELWQTAGWLLDSAGDGLAGVVAYPAFSRRWVAALGPVAGKVLSALAEEGPDAGLCGHLRGYISHMVSAGELHRPAYADLVYFSGFLRLLEPLGKHAAAEREEFLREQLLRGNFNHLAFLAYLQQQFRSGRMEAMALREGPALVFREGPAYDPGLPGIRELLGGWLREWQAPPAVGLPRPAVKLKLDLSVAHLACLLRTLHEAGAVAMPLSELFRAVPCCFSSRRREQLSAGSFNKEFYSASQFTAARVRELLLRMAGLISARYFPVVAAIMLTFLRR